MHPLWYRIYSLENYSHVTLQLFVYFCILCYENCRTLRDNFQNVQLNFLCPTIMHSVFELLENFLFILFFLWFFSRDSLNLWILPFFTKNKLPKHLKSFVFKIYFRFLDSFFLISLKPSIFLNNIPFLDERSFFSSIAPRTSKYIHLRVLIALSDDISSCRNTVKVQPLLVEFD